MLGHALAPPIIINYLLKNNLLFTWNRLFFTKRTAEIVYYWQKYVLYFFEYRVIIPKNYLCGMEEYL